MKVYIFAILLAFALSTTFIREEQEEIVLADKGTDLINKVVDCVRGFRGSAACVNSIKTAIKNKNLNNAFEILKNCKSAAVGIFNGCKDLVKIAIDFFKSLKK
jgi:hypothetical protein